MNHLIWRAFRIGVNSITADTDIRAFLQSRVPLQLTQAALRRTWTADPAIRDFIGIAEGQWDFNDPNAIPGFGPLQEVQRVPDSLSQTVQETSALAETIPQLPASVEEVRSSCESPRLHNDSECASIIGHSVGVRQVR